MTSQKTGMSALGLQRVLGFGSYETAWAWLHKLRRAMVRPDRELLGGPGGLVELDETLVGGKTAGTDGAGSDKVPVMVAVERIGPRKCGWVRLGVAARPGSTQLLDFLPSGARPGRHRAHRRSADDAQARPAGLRPRVPHRPHLTRPRPRDPARCPPGRLAAQTLDRRHAAPAVSDKHLEYYLDEFTFRFNRRTSTSRGLLFYRLLQQAVAPDPRPLTELVHPTRA